MDKYLSVVPKIPSVLIIWELFVDFVQKWFIYNEKCNVDKDGEYVEHKQNGLKFNNSWFQFGVTTSRRKW